MFFSLGSITSLTWGHTLVKVLSITSPYITPFDVVLFMGCLNSFTSILYALIEGVNINIFSYPRKITLLIILRGILGLLINLSWYFALAYLSLSKWTIIMSISPIFWAILASIILKENINAITIICIFGAVTGIYFLSLNQEGNGKIKENPLGYIFMIIYILSISTSFIVMRTLNKYSLHVSINNGIQGVMFVILSIFMYFFYGDYINIEKYKTSDFIALSGNFIFY